MLRKHFPITLTITHAPTADFSFPEVDMFDDVVSYSIGPMRKRARISHVDGTVTLIDDSRPFLTIKAKMPCIGLFEALKAIFRWKAVEESDQDVYRVE